MLTVYRSNRAEWLAELLATQLRLDPPDPFEAAQIDVNTWPTSRWLAEQLAVANGINALTSFPFPGVELRQLVRMVTGEDVDIEDPWRANRLVWTVLELLPDLLEVDDSGSLLEWINKKSLVPGQLNKGEWKLARTIAAHPNILSFKVEELSISLIK